MPPAREQARVTLPRWWAFVCAGLCYSLFTAVAFPPASVWVLAVFAPVPLIWAGCRAVQHPLRCAALTAVGVLPLWFYENLWVIDVTGLGYPLMAVYLSVYAGLFVWLLSLLRRLWTPKGRSGALIPVVLLAPIVWTALEVLRGEVMFTGYPWYLAGHPLIETPRLAAPAGLLGAYFVSFLVVALGGGLADAAGWSNGKRGVGGIGAGVVCVLWVITASLGRPEAARKPPAVARVGVIQTNIPQDNKLGWTLAQRVQDLARFVQLTRDAAAARPRVDMIVWPETMFPAEALNQGFRDDLLAALRLRGRDPAKDPSLAFIAKLLELQAEIGIPIVLGAESIEGMRFVKNEAGNEVLRYDRRYNSVFLVEGGKVHPERYDKMELTPFGEVIPYVWRWKSLQDLIVNVGAGGMRFDLAIGTELTVFSIAPAGGSAAPDGQDLPARLPIELVTPICFEATKSALCRRLTYDEDGRRASLILNLSNDGWFGPATGWRGMVSGGRLQHLLAARWRCVELGVPMVRAVNTGISASIERDGKIRQQGPDGRDYSVNVDGVLIASVELPDAASGTVFGRIGNVFGWGAVAATALLIPLGMLVGRRRANRPVSPA